MTSTSIRLGELADRLGGRLTGSPDIAVSGIAPVSEAGSGHITFLSNSKLRHVAAASQAAALMLTEADYAQIGADFQGVCLIVPNPYVCFARVAQWFVTLNTPAPVAGVHPDASVATTAVIAATATIGANAVIGEEVVIGEHTLIEPGVVLARGVSIGAGSRIYPNVSVYEDCVIGDRCIIHSGAVIGADGFGFANDKGSWVKIPQTGRVVIGNDVEIGANTSIDRGALADTVIEDGVKLDNQIQIGHNCHIGAHTAMAGCVGVAGSAKIGKHCTFGGAAMILGHLTIADNVHISSGSLVSRSISEPGQYTGFYPLAKNADWEKTAAIVRNLGTMREKLRQLEKITKNKE